MDLIYAKYGDRSLRMDLYRPLKAQCGLPAVVCIHGGGWIKGNRKNHSKIALALASRGYVAVTMSYRLSGEAPFPAAIHDCKAAVRFLRSHAEKLGVNPDKIGAIGLQPVGTWLPCWQRPMGKRCSKEKVEIKNSAAEFKLRCRWELRPTCFLSEFKNYLRKD